jgi:transposase-like protein
MLALFTSNPDQIPKLRSALPPHQRVKTAEQWDELEHLAPSVSCCVIHIRWLQSDPSFPRLCAFRTRHPHHPVVLVTRWDPDNARSLKDIVIEEVVWFGEIERELEPAVDRACTLNDLHCLAAEIDSMDSLAMVLRKALAFACRSEKPVHSINQLARSVGCDRRTLWYQWNQAVPASSLFRLQDFLHWVLLLRAATRKTSGRNWTSVAEDLGVHPHTLGRWARQLASVQLRDLGTARHTEVAALFRRWVGKALMGRGSLDIL